jgi:hypothetical protein
MLSSGAHKNLQDKYYNKLEISVYNPKTYMCELYVFMIEGILSTLEDAVCLLPC